MSLGPWQIALIVLLILVLFGRGRISEMMGDIGKGIKSFKKGISDEEEKKQPPPPRIENKPAESNAQPKQESDKVSR